MARPVREIAWMRTQTTLRRAVRVSGKGLHSGRTMTATLHPAEPGQGLLFYRSDVDALIPAVAEEAGRLDYATSLGPKGREVGTVEHLLSAAYGIGLDNAVVAVDGPEVPILDGSSLLWAERILAAGLVSQGAPVEPLTVDRTITIPAPAGKHLEIRPARELRISYSIDFPHPAVGNQSISLVINPEAYLEHLAPARTFGFLAEYDWLRSKGLAQGADETNCIVIGEERVENGALRFADEFVRHKALDLLGDLALVGRPVVGHVIAHRAGHALHAALAAHLRQGVEAEERSTTQSAVAAY